MFGRAKPAAPKATLQDAHDSMEKRGDSIDQKIMKLDKELGRCAKQGYALTSGWVRGLGLQLGVYHPPFPHCIPMAGTHVHPRAKRTLRALQVHGAA